MKDLALRLYVRSRVLRDVLQDESGQDMVEYALVMGLIAMGSVIAMKGLATSIGSGLSSIGQNLTADTS